jgi:glycosyltransferase involved in cell wall biosynthesis
VTAVKPLVSVITIFLNEERFLAQAVESVLGQTYDEWELLLCDDGSTDGSTAIAKAYADRYPDRVRYLDHPGHVNRGMSATRNLGLAHGAGRLVGFLDADDVWLPEKLERDVAALERNPAAGMVVAPALYWHSWTGDTGDTGLDQQSRVGAAPGRITRGPKVLHRILRGSAEALCTCAVLVRRDAVVAVGGFEDRFQGLFEDQAFFAKILLDYDVCSIPDCLALYRQHSDSCCAQASQTLPLLAARHREYLEWLSSYARSRPRQTFFQHFLAQERWLRFYGRLREARVRARERRRAAVGRVAMFAYAVGRIFIPTAARVWLHDRLGARR